MIVDVKVIGSGLEPEGSVMVRDGLGLAKLLKNALHIIEQMLDVVVRERPQTKNGNSQRK
jgi:hypothetical protein